MNIPADVPASEEFELSTTLAQFTQRLRDNPKATLGKEFLQCPFVVYDLLKKEISHGGTRLEMMEVLSTQESHRYAICRVPAVS